MDVWNGTGPRWMDPTERNAILTHEGTELAQGFQSGFAQAFGRSQGHNMMLQDQQRIAGKVMPIAQAFGSFAPLATGDNLPAAVDTPDQYSEPLLPGGDQSSPGVGAVMDGYRFKGGDPSDPNNWEKVN